MTCGLGAVSAVRASARGNTARFCILEKAKRFRSRRPGVLLRVPNLRRALAGLGIAGIRVCPADGALGALSSDGSAGAHYRVHLHYPARRSAAAREASPGWRAHGDYPGPTNAPGASNRLSGVPVCKCWGYLHFIIVAVMGAREKERLPLSEPMPGRGAGTTPRDCLIIAPRAADTPPASLLPPSLSLRCARGGLARAGCAALGSADLRPARVPLNREEAADARDAPMTR